VGGGIDPNLEMIVGLRPDVVFVAGDANRWGTLVLLERLNIPVYGVKPIGVEGVFDSIEKVGEAVGRRQQAEALIAGMRRRLDAVSAKVRDLAKPKVLYAVWVDPLIVAGRETVIDDLIGLAGGANAVRERGFPRLGLEEVFAHPPDLILLAFDRGGVGYRDVLPRLPGWKEMPAVRQGAVRVIDGNLMNRPGPRIVEAVEVLARMLHPEAFGGSRP
jgi:iron complex transport system substrate-binding protein